MFFYLIKVVLLREYMVKDGLIYELYRVCKPANFSLSQSGDTPQLVDPHAAIWLPAVLVLAS